MRLNFHLLAIGLRGRPESVAELAAYVRKPVEEVRRDVEQLAEAGYLAVSGERIAFSNPAPAIAEDVRRQIDALTSKLVTFLDQIGETAEATPALVDSDRWARGDQWGGVQIFRGESAMTDLWHQVLRTTPMRRTDIVLPDASPLGVADPEMQRSWHEAIGAAGNRARVLGSVTDAASPHLQTRIAQEVDAGVEIRFRHELPSWFWVADDEIVALPLEWGESWPTAVVAFRDTAIAGVVRWVFEQLWAGAVAPNAGASSWDPLLRLMATGSTLEAAARALGISERTGRRRLAEAMDHFGASSPIALGVLWGQRTRWVG